MKAMNQLEKKASNTSLPELLKQIKLNTRFKAAVLSSDLWEENTKDTIFEDTCTSSEENTLFKLLLKLRKIKKASAFEEFLTFLKGLKLFAAIEILQQELAKHSSQIDSSGLESCIGNKAANVLATATSLRIPEDQKEEALVHTTASTVVLSREACTVLKKDLRKALSYPHSKKKHGDIAVSDAYFSKAYKFASENRPLESPPGPLEEFDLSRKTFPDKFSFLAPEACAKISRTIGGKAQLSYFERRGHDVLCTVDGTVSFCHAHVVLAPGNITKCKCWLGVNFTLGEVLGEIVTWNHFGAKMYGTDETLNLSMKVAEWQSRTPTYDIEVCSIGLSGDALSIPAKRDLIEQDLTTAGYDDSFHVLVTWGYRKAVRQFASSNTDKEPGRVKVPGKAASLNAFNVAFLPPECVSTLIALYGGTVSLRKSTIRGPITLVDNRNHNQYYTCVLYILNSINTQRTLHGTYFFARDTTLYEAIASAMGCFPTRAYSPHKQSQKILDLQANVRDWFGSPRSTEIVVEMGQEG